MAFGLSENTAARAGTIVITNSAANRRTEIALGARSLALNNPKIPLRWRPPCREYAVSHFSHKRPMPNSRDLAVSSMGLLVLWATQFAAPGEQRSGHHRPLFLGSPLR